jgi:hypothetical protein
MHDTCDDSDDVRRPTTDDRRPTTDDRRPTTEEGLGFTDVQATEKEWLVCASASASVF